MKLADLVVGETYACGRRNPDGTLPGTLSRCRYLGPAIQGLLDEHQCNAKPDPDLAAITWLRSSAWTSTVPPGALLMPWSGYRQELLAQRAAGKAGREANADRKRTVKAFLDRFAPGWDSPEPSSWQPGLEVHTTERVGTTDDVQVVVPMGALSEALLAALGPMTAQDDPA